MRIVAEPGHLRQRLDEALQRRAVRLDCQTSIHRRLPSIRPGAVWGR